MAEQDSTSRRRSRIRTARPISAMPTRSSPRTRSPASSGSTATTSSSSPAPTSTGSRSSRPRRRAGPRRAPSSTRWRRSFRAMAERLSCSFDRFIRTTDPDHLPSTQELWRRMQARGRHLSVQIHRLVLGPRRGLLRRERADEGAGRDLAGADRDARRMGRGGELLLPPLRLPGPAARALRAASDLHRPGDAPQRDRQLRARRAAGPLHQPHHVRLGPARARRSEARDVCLDRRPQQLRHGLRLPRRDGGAVALLAGRRPHHRQGHRALPYGLLAGLPDVGRAAAAEAGLRPRLPVQPRREDVEVGRQRHRPVRAGGCLRRRPAPLLLPARGAVRPGRQLFARGDRQPHQRRPRQRSRQSGAALAVDDRAQLRRRRPRARAS